MTTSTRARHTKRAALRELREQGITDDSVGDFVHRMRADGIDDRRIGWLLGFPESIESESLRRALNRWEASDGFSTEVDSAARAAVGHAENRFARAINVLPYRVRADGSSIIRVTLLDQLTGEDAERVADFLAAFVALRDAEIAANVLNLPRDVMPGAVPVSWKMVEDRLSELRSQLTESKRRQIVAGYIKDETHRQQQRVIAALVDHPNADAIYAELAASGEPRWTGLSRDPWAETEFAAGAEDRPAPKRRRLSWLDRRHVTHERQLSRLPLEQRVADDCIRLAAVPPSAAT